MTIDLAESGLLRTWVRVIGLIPGEETVIWFVPEDETDPATHRLPRDSFLGKLLMGTEVGDRVSIDALDNEIALEVLATGTAE